MLPPPLLYVRVPFCYFSFSSPGATPLAPVLHSLAKTIVTSFVDYESMLPPPTTTTAVLSVKDVVLSTLGHKYRKGTYFSIRTIQLLISFAA